MLRRSAFLLALATLVVGLGVVVDLQDSRQVRAGPPPAVTARDADAVRDSGTAISLVATSVDGVGVLEPKLAAGRPTLRSLAASLDGSALAFSPVGIGQVGPLTIARADGSQLEISLPGVRGAAYEPAGAWLAAVDLHGALWRVDAASGSASRLADGPFAADVTVLADGRVLAVRVSSIEAPIWASAEWIDSDSGSAVPVGAAATQAQLVYRATTLVDGAVALVRHRTGGGVDIVRVEDDGQELPLAGSSIPGVTISTGGDRVAWIEGGTAWLGWTTEGPSAFAIGAAASVSFAPDGSLLMAVGSDGARLVDLAGSERAEIVGEACWLGGGRGCRP